MSEIGKKNIDSAKPREKILEDIYNNRIKYCCTGKTELETPVNTACPTTADLVIKYVLTYGNKKITVSFLTFADSVQTYIENIPAKEVKIENTTILYEVAKRIMQEYANKNSTSIDYLLSTSFEKMKAWAQNPKKGAGLFDWKRLDPTTEFTREGKKKYFFTCEIKPEDEKK